MSVLPGYRGKGRGTKLLNHLLNAAAEEFIAVSLSVSLTNPARRMYGRAVFEPVGEPEGGSVTMVKNF